MTSLADLFNPTFLMFLGILVLVIALLVVYFESKMREQNHKIASMLSLVSTLAEDMNGVKMGITHLAFKGGNGPNISLEENLENSNINRLIEVSDDEGSRDEDDDDEELEEELEEDEELEEELEETDSDESELDEHSEDEDQVKVIKLQVSNEDTEDINSYEEADNLDFDAAEDLDEFNISDEIPEIAQDYVEEILDLKYDGTPEEIKPKHLEETNILSTSELKTISINLGDDLEDTIDYKKLQLPKLRSIAVEKGLASNSDASKMKKPELLKLLGAE
jgi:hypothetical protein